MYKPGLSLLPNQNKTQHNHAHTLCDMLHIDDGNRVIYQNCCFSSLFRVRHVILTITCCKDICEFNSTVRSPWILINYFDLKININCELWAAFAHGERSLSTELLTNVSSLPVGVLQNKTRDRYDLFQSALKYLFNFPISLWQTTWVWTMHGWESIIYSYLFSARM